MPKGPRKGRTRISRNRFFPLCWHRVTAGRLVFSDGTTLPVGPLPDDATAAREITFNPKTINWLTFTVTEVKPKTQNAGLSEIAAFTD